MSAARTAGTAGRGDAASRRSRVGRTLVAVLGVSCVALTAAAAQPLGPRDLSRSGEVVALGGLGSIDPLSPGGDGATAGDRSTGSSGSGAGDGPPVGAGVDLGFDPGFVVAFASDVDLAYEIPVPGQEPAAPFTPSGTAGFSGGAGIPAASLRAYRAAAEVLAREASGCGIDWALLAGIGRVEANHGRFGGAVVSDQGVSVPRILGPRLDGTLANTQVIRDSDGGTLDGDAAYDRAVGPMQFLPGTWKRWGSDGDRDGVSNPQDIDDAALAGARYLCAGRSGLADRAQAALAVRRYNNSSSYVDLVLATAAGYRSGVDGFVGLVGSPVAPPPPGWMLPPGTVVGAAAAVPPAGPSAPSSEPAAATGPTGPPPAGPTTPPTDPPSVPPSVPPSGEPTMPPAPTGEPSVVPTTAVPVPTEPACEPTATEPTSDPGGAPVLAPCPAPCGSLPPATEPTVSPTCAPVPPGSPTP